MDLGRLKVVVVVVVVVNSGKNQARVFLALFLSLSRGLVAIFVIVVSDEKEYLKSRIILYTDTSYVFDWSRLRRRENTVKD